MGREVKVGRRDATLVISKRVPVRLSGIGAVYSATFGEMFDVLGARGIEASGPPFVIYHDMPSGDDPFDVEFCAPIAAAFEPPGEWAVQELPAGDFATLVHVGPYESVDVAYDTINEWIAEHGLSVAGPPREVYLSPPETPPDQIRTIVEFPVAQMAAPVGRG